MHIPSGLEVRTMWIIGSPLDNALAVLALGIVCLLLARVAYGPAERS